eukprot:TRINITY_DN72829_c0_g1_i1.p1 TRINITY_DN72829_c0_g1~~TRINITY_DN72829_c0_g1_i1.p1  ORF type:complete len:539 (+),score=123.58 TRINITY_DN72829_c0_g1_i1:102-1619(+)
MRLPPPVASIDWKKRPFKVLPSKTIMQLMEETEMLVEEMCKDDEPVQFQIQVLWNQKDSKKALNPGDKIGDHFVAGDTFCCHGDIVTAPKQHPKIPEDQKLPVTILTGFLGAGKTTLLNYILQEQREKKIAVIENEFGEVSIDDSLLKQDKLALAEKIVVMDNGCMCCTVRGDLAEGLNNIMKEVKKGAKIDQIMIETTGMADPVPIVRTFMTSEEISSEIRLDGVIAVADAKHILDRLDDNIEEGKVNEAYQQVAFCDKILLNKLDLVSPDYAIKVKERLRSINAFAKILPAVKSRVKISELTDLRAHDMTNFVNEEIEKEAEDVEHGHGGHGGGHAGGHAHGDGHDPDCTEDHGHGGGHGHGGAHGNDGGHGGGHGGGHAAEGHGHGHKDEHGHAAKKSRHDSRVNSMAIVREGEILPQKLGAFMQTLGQLPPEKGTIFRIKGILAVKNHPYKHVFHAVMDVSDEEDAGPWAPGEKKVSKMVFIGKGLDKKFIRDGFEDIFEK